ncbi:pentapeptide repeat-containing protein [Argonema antarcticum]|uniref:pentapeptide repeat-containing protein n=1 Tax=Argonema antarcticum TaxID=2942763 RepID=UPI002011ACC6|nr:pentapeptide repeat-containing protein [Argonema antarcticum]MCL1471136.1 pentapeptide repeat-containing protein [Argonema antarcticum A004/B2]
MPENPGQPRHYDVVLGGKTPPPLTGAVLGGLAGVKQRLRSTVAEHRIAALMEAPHYGEAGLDSIVQALDDKAEQVRDTACILLQGKLAKLTLLKKDVATWNKWRSHSIRLEEGINVDLSAINLSGFNLSGFNLSSANLMGANLSGANLRGADLRGANLSEANLSGADLRQANLAFAGFWNADLRQANLTEANLTQADLRRANLGGATMADGTIHE